ncbi:rhodanese-like domain-containing protein [Marinoscillum sp. MHG1-6]|uniref:rhodanese-like domain-containing protein n=1 Tax=Marinoscillum sp. MHG1-6 TaxID=2959627 RepID=UPI0021586561|nr:rhodanese-like domain-containing protein [Marinoscillum sp. MHG1-6]
MNIISRQITLKWVGFNLLTLFTLTTCGQSSYDEKLESIYSFSVPLIKVDSLGQLLNKKHITIFDTRSPVEFEVSHLPNATFIDYSSFSDRSFEKLPRETPIVVYCSVGYRSEKVGEYLQELGFTNICNLYGGIFEWKNNGMQVVNENNELTDSLHTYNENWSKWLLKGIKVYE